MNEIERLTQVIRDNDDLEYGSICKLAEIDREARKMKQAYLDLRKSHTELHRRCQLAEAALKEKPDIDRAKFVSGNLGRALLAWHNWKLNEQNTELIRLLNEALFDFEAENHTGCFKDIIEKIKAAIHER